MRLRRLVPLSAARTRRPLVAVAAGIALLGLAGCSAGGEEAPASDDGSAAVDCTTPGADNATASGDVGDAPEFTWPQDCPPEGLQVDVIAEGDGTDVGTGAVVVANYAGYVWGSDTPFDSSYERGEPSTFSLNSVVEGWSAGIPDHPIGSRLLISIPPDLGYGPEGNSGAGIGGTDTIVFVVDVVDAFNATDAGQADATTLSPELPVTVEGDLGEPATISVPGDVPEPTEAEVYPISQGSGEPVTAGQNVVLAYAVTFWDGSSSETTWAAEGGEQPAEAAPVGPIAVPIGQGQGSVFDLLEGTTVGSRVVMTAPGSQGGPAVALVADVLGIG